MAVVLGPTGRNFGAGMTNGRAFVLDVDGEFEEKVNADSVTIQRGIDGCDEVAVRELIERHVKLTHSAFAKELLSNWTETRARIWTVIPTATLALVQAPVAVEPERIAGVAD
jgi:glutamate synthase domain-containing protein 3